MSELNELSKDNKRLVKIRTETHKELQRWYYGIIDVKTLDNKLDAIRAKYKL